jgi:hypothetical protein
MQSHKKMALLPSRGHFRKWTCDAISLGRYGLRHTSCGHDSEWALSCDTVVGVRYVLFIVCFSICIWRLGVKWRKLAAGVVGCYLSRQFMDVLQDCLTVTFTGSWVYYPSLALACFSRMLWKPNFHYRSHKCPSPVPFLSQLDLVLTPHPTSEDPS